MIGADEPLVRALVAWTTRAATPEERQDREAEVCEQLLVGIDEEETARVERLIEAAQVPAVVATPTAGAAAPAAAPPAPAPTRRAKLYDPARRGYMRATVEDGIAAELDEMFREARGTPFFDSRPARPATPAGSLAERLRLAAGRGKPKRK